MSFNIEFTFHRPLTSGIKTVGVEEGPSCMKSVWCSLLKYTDGLSVNKLYLFWDTEKKNVLNSHDDGKKRPLHSRGAGGRVGVAGGGLGEKQEVVLHHEMKAYVTTIFVINMRNGNILWEDFIINELKRLSVHHGEMTAELSHSGKLCWWITSS